MRFYASGRPLHSALRLNWPVPPFFFLIPSLGTLAPARVRIILETLIVSADFSVWRYFSRPLALFRANLMSAYFNVSHFDTKVPIEQSFHLRSLLHFLVNGPGEVGPRTLQVAGQKPRIDKIGARYFPLINWGPRWGSAVILRLGMTKQEFSFSTPSFLFISSSNIWRRDLF